MSYPDAVARAISELGEYWGAGLRAVPEQVFRTPDIAADFVAERLHLLRESLSPAEYAYIRETIRTFSTGETRASRRTRAEHAWRLAQENSVRLAEQKVLEAEAAERFAREEPLRRAAQAASRAQQAARRAEQRVLLAKGLEGDFLRVDRSFFQTLGPEDDWPALQEIRNHWIAEWCRKHLGFSLDGEQAAAIGAHRKHTLVAARAGSGKTRILVARAAFLLTHCRVSPHEVLLLAFNQKAAQEMRERLTAVGCPMPFVMTFHALAYAIVHPSDDMLMNDASDGTGTLRTAVERTVQDLLSDPSTYAVVREVMTAHYAADWARLERGHFSMGPQAALALLRSPSLETLNGEFVRSLGEQAIANFLFEHAMPYRYEQTLYWDGRPYRPDFTVSLGRKELVIEYFGLLGDPAYDRDCESKRAFWKKRPEVAFLELSPSDLSKGRKHLATRLTSWFREHDVTCDLLSDDEIWNRIRDRALTRFGELTQTFIGRCRQQRYTPDAVRAIINRAADSGPESAFYSLMPIVLERYLQRLREEGQEDFSGLVARAIEAMTDGVTGFQRRDESGDLSQLRFLMIDEFQDFSLLFMGLTERLRIASPRAQVLAVGDDWQAINGFAGASTRYFTGFADHFRPHMQLAITTNYRSAPSIVASSNALMAGEGPAARAHKSTAGKVLLGGLDDFYPTPHERDHDTLLTAAMRRLIAHFVGLGQSVAVLWRTNRPTAPVVSDISPKDLTDCHRVWTKGFTPDDHDRVTVTTVHKYKGGQADVVIIPDAVFRRYPLLHPDWRYGQLFGDNVEQLTRDDKRLFYVACTRAMDTLILLTGMPGDEPSPFIPLLGDQVRRFNWDDFPPAEIDTKRWIIRVRNRAGAGTTPTRDIKAQLMAERFEFRGGLASYWELAVPRDGNDVPAAMAMLARQAWSMKGKNLDVGVFDAALVLHGSFTVDDGVWQARHVGVVARRPGVPASR